MSLGYRDMLTNVRAFVCQFSCWNFTFCCSQKANKHCWFNKKRTLLASRQVNWEFDEYGSQKGSWVYFLLLLYIFLATNSLFLTLKFCNVSKEVPLWKKMKTMLAGICWLCMLATYEIHEDNSQCLLIIQVNRNGPFVVHPYIFKCKYVTLQKFELSYLWFTRWIFS